MSDDLKAINLTREELHEKVWTTPINAIAKQYSVRDHDIIKLCDKNNIPRPPCGYWSKFRHGFRLDRPPLPTMDSTSLSSTPSKPVVERPERKRSPAPPQPKIKYSANEPIEIKSPHPLITQTYRAYGSIHPDKSDRLRAKDAALNVWVGYNNLDRALYIMDLLIKELEAQNYSVSIEKNYSGDSWLTQVNINGVGLPFHIEESTAKKPVATSDLNPRWRNQNYELVPTGILSLIIDNFLGESRQKSWSDTKASVLEQKLPEIIDGLIEAAAKLKVIRADEEKRREQIRIEEALRREIEAQERFKREQIAQLEPCALSWEKADRIKRFISALEAAAIEKFGTIEPGGNIDSLIKTALSYSDSIDPVIQTLKTLDRNPPT